LRDEDVVAGVGGDDRPAVVERFAVREALFDQPAAEPELVARGDGKVRVN
jgi:hypothetical protein